MTIISCLCKINPPTTVLRSVVDPREMTAYQWIRDFMKAGKGTQHSDGIGWCVAQGPDGWRIYSERGYGLLMSEVKREEPM